MEYFAKSKYQPGGELLRIPQMDINYRYPKYHNVSNRFIFADMLEIAQISNPI